MHVVFTQQTDNKQTLSFDDRIDDKADFLKGIVKTGRTHLMDAMPIDFSEELKACLLYTSDAADE